MNNAQHVNRETPEKSTHKYIDCGRNEPTNDRAVARLVGPSGVRQLRDPNLFRMEYQTMLQVRLSYRVVAETYYLLREGSLSPH